MAEPSLTTDGFLETTSIDPLNEDSLLMETGDLSMEEETALLCRNPRGEDVETENEIPCAQVNQKRAKKTNKPPIETRKAKLPFDVRPAISSKSNQRNGKRPRDEHEKSAKTAARDEHEKSPKRPPAPTQRKPAKMTSRAPPSKRR